MDVRNILSWFLRPAAQGRRSIKWGSHPPGDPVVAGWLGAGSETASGVSVDSGSAERIAAVYACVLTISETLAMLPLLVFRRQDDDGRERDSSHPLYDVLHRRPNSYQTSFEFRQMMQRDVLLCGNAYARIVSGPGQAVRELHRLYPARMRPFWRDRAATQIAYELRQPDGAPEILLQSEVFHLRGLGDDPLCGLNPIELHRETLGEHLGAQRLNARTMANDGRPGGVLETEGHFKDDAERMAYLESFRKAQTGENRGKVGLLERGIKFKEIKVSAADMEFLNQRKYTRSEIAAIFRVPPHMIGDLQESTNNNIERQSLDFWINTMAPWGVRWEQAIDRDLFTGASRNTHYAAFVWEGILRADSAARAQFYKELWMLGSMSANDINRRENLNPVPGGDRYYVPANMIPVDMLDEFLRRNNPGRKEALPA